MRLIALPKEPRWLDLPLGMRVKVRPVNSAIQNAALYQAKQEFVSLLTDARTGGADMEQVENLLSSSEALKEGMFQYLYAVGLGEVAILAWEGVDDADGNPAPVNPANVRLFMDVPGISQAFIREYEAPLRELAGEGNGSASGLNGRDKGAAPTAKAAKTRKPRARKAAPA